MNRNCNMINIDDDDDEEQDNDEEEQVMDLKNIFELIDRLIL
jgi:hypothetical protein